MEAFRRKDGHHYVKENQPEQQTIIRNSFGFFKRRRQTSILLISLMCTCSFLPLSLLPKLIYYSHGMIRMPIPTQKITFFALISIGIFPLIWIVIHFVLILDYARGNGTILRSSNNPPSLSSINEGRRTKQMKHRRPIRQERWRRNWEPLLPTIEE